MYRIKLSAHAKRQLKGVKKLYRKEAVEEIFSALKDDPFIGKPLVRELTGQYRIQVGVYRIIYLINTQNKIVTILTVGHRSIVYQ